MGDPLSEGVRLGLIIFTAGTTVIGLIVVFMSIAIALDAVFRRLSR